MSGYEKDETFSHMDLEGNKEEYKKQLDFLSEIKENSFVEINGIPLTVVRTETHGMFQDKPDTLIVQVLNDSNPVEYNSFVDCKINIGGEDSLDLFREDEDFSREPRTLSESEFKARLEEIIINKENKLKNLQAQEVSTKSFFDKDNKDVDISPSQDDILHEKTKLENEKEEKVKQLEKSIQKLKEFIELK